MSTFDEKLNEFKELADSDLVQFSHNEADGTVWVMWTPRPRQIRGGTAEEALQNAINFYKGTYTPPPDNRQSRPLPQPAAPSVSHDSEISEVVLSNDSGDVPSESGEETQ